MTPERRQARQQILEEANSWRSSINPMASVLRTRHMNKAVAIVRNNKIVSPDLLVQAGYRPVRTR